MVNKILGLLIVLFLSTSFVNGYFEHKYYCKTQDGKIRVSQREGEGYYKCFDLIQKINNQTQLSIENIKKAQEYIDKNEDVEFWKDVQKQTLDKLNNGELAKVSIISSMKSFENQLFVKTKKVLDYYLNKRLVELELIINNHQLNMEKNLGNGDIKKYKETNLILEKYLSEKIVIKNLINSTDFHILMPTLQFWYHNYYKNL